MPTGKRIKTPAALNQILFARRNGAPQPAAQPAAQQAEGDIEVRGIQREIDEIADRMEENANLPLNVGLNQDVLNVVRDDDASSTSSEEEEKEKKYSLNVIKYLNGASYSTNLYLGNDDKTIFCSIRNAFRVDIHPKCIVFTCLRNIPLNQIHNPSYSYYLPLPSSLNDKDPKKDMNLMTSSVDYEFFVSEQDEPIICNLTFTEEEGPPHTVAEEQKRKLYNKYYLRISIQRNLLLPENLQLVLIIDDLAPPKIADEYKPPEKKKREEKDDKKD